MATIDTTRLSLGDVVTSARGAKTVPILDARSAPLWKPGRFEALFRPSAFNEPASDRVSVIFRETPEVVEEMQKLDLWVLQKVAENPLNFFGKNMTYEEIRQRYTGALRTNDRGQSSLRAKMNLSGRYAVQCWTPQGEPREPPPDWQNIPLEPQFVVRNLWLMGNSFGLLLEVSDCKITDWQKLSPF